MVSRKAAQRPRRVAELSLGLCDRERRRTQRDPNTSAVPEGGFRVTWSAMNSSVVAAASATMPGIGIRRLRRRYSLP